MARLTLARRPVTAGAPPPAGRDRALQAWLAQLLAGGGERRARLRTLTVIRWIAIVGQAFTILFVHFSLEFRLPLVPLLLAVLLSALVNLTLTLAFSATTRLTERSSGLLLGYDVLQLTFLLALTGGLRNPFAILLMVPVTLSATILSLRTTVILCGFVMLDATLLALLPTELPWRDGGLALPALYILAVWIALVLGTGLVAGYAWRVANEARRMSDALSATQMVLAREQQLSALGSLAAAAAHELGSPLATIAVTARELANNMPKDSPMAEDIAELVSQSQRCRDILRSLSEARPSDEHRRFTRLPLTTLLAELAEQRQRASGAPAIVVDGAAAAGQPRLIPTPELKHALGNLIDNAIQFASARVTISVRCPADLVEIAIEDDGPGFLPEVLDTLGEPYVSTRHEGGGLGLGIFIAETLLARTGATLQFGNLDRGARVTVTWQRAALEDWFGDTA